MPAAAPASIQPILRRLPGGMLFAACLALLLVAAGLTPNDKRIGTHTQLGLAPCGFEMASGLPCATCGMTTAFSHATDGNLPAAFYTQPTGALLAIFTAMACLVGLWSLWQGVSLAPLGRIVLSGRFLLPLIAVILLAWSYTALRAVMT
jgi:hypothetical protein